MNRFCSYFICVFVMLCLAACERGLYEGDGEAADVLLKFEAEPEITVGDGTKAAPDGVTEGTGQGYVVSDFWMFEYNSNGLLVGKPRYYENASAGVTVSVFRPSSGIYKCYVIANTHNPGFLAEIDDYSTESALKKAYRKVNSYDDLWQDGTVQGEYDLLMSGVMEIGSDAGSSLTCKLKRNVAKLTLTLVNAAGSQVTLNTVQLKNVPDHLFYADVMYEGASKPSPGESESGFVSLDAETINLTEGSSISMVYYLPRNMRGDSGSASVSSDKNKNAPGTASYVEIMATNDNTATSLRYRFYIGKDMLDNFDVEPNYHYVLPVTFNNKGSETDSRVEDMGLVHLEDANSYILQPLSTVAQTMYTIPVSGRVNKFWNSSEGKKIGSSYSDYLIGIDTEWVAEIIWQDVPQKVLLFCDENGKEFDDGVFSTVGDELLYFRLTQAAFNNPCNVLIGVKKKDASSYMWSWHVWITDYDPDQNVDDWKDNQYSYTVTGGNVHRYSGTYWNQNLSGKYIMDRNLGARSALRSAGLMNNAGFGYQFGRKDPFPMVRFYPFYDKDGNQITFNGTSLGDPIAKTDGPAWMYQSIQNPAVYYNDPSPHEDWLKNEDIYTYIWNDIDGKSTGKSFFDPCPPGWKIPEKGTWDGLSTAVLIESSWSSGATLGWDLYMGPKEASETVFFPIAGWRNLSNGAIGYNQSVKDDNYIFTRLWVSKPNGKTSAFFINLGRTSAENNPPNVSPNASNFRSYGNSVRCIQE